VLDQAVDLRRRLDVQRGMLEADASKIVLVVGKASSTPAGIRMTDGGVVYQATSDGDGRVTLDNALSRLRSRATSSLQRRRPIELEPFLSGSSSVLLQLDNPTAYYPWELLDTQHDETDAQDDPRPWAVRTRMLRKLRTAEFRDRPMDARRDAGALVIGEPQSDPQNYPPLPAASEEALAVANVLRTQAQLKLDALEVVNAAYERPYRVIHIAGHGDLFNDGTGGVVLSGGAVFGPREIEAMRGVPELAFINCCYLGRIDPASKRKASALGKERPRFAASVAEALISNGVRCVVAAGWAVDDAPAKLFATRFYEALMDGRTFAEAVGHAREQTPKSTPRATPGPPISATAIRIGATCRLAMLAGGNHPRTVRSSCRLTLGWSWRRWWSKRSTMRRRVTACVSA
jgi:hypothetical protein